MVNVDKKYNEQRILFQYYYLYCIVYIIYKINYKKKMLIKYYIGITTVYIIVVSTI